MTNNMTKVTPASVKNASVHPAASPLMAVSSLPNQSPNKSPNQSATTVQADGTLGCTTTCYLMRHGECDGGQILRGHTDVALTQKGRRQMLDSLARHDVEFDAIISSPLKRCNEFALSQYLQHGVPLKIEEGLKEIDFGDWDGQLLESLYQSNAHKLDSYWQDPWSNTPPNGEPMQDFEARVDTVWHSILSQYKGESLLVVTHGGVIRHLMSRALGVSGAAGFYSRLSLAYAAIVKVTVFTSPNGESFTRLHWGVED